MGKKKNLDFKKLKVKIGKSKPSNNVTKFNIKTSKVVVSGPSKTKINQKTSNYFSNDEKDLMENLKTLQTHLSKGLSQKNQIMLKHSVDLTQSVWRGLFNPKWTTPWDHEVDKYEENVGCLDGCSWWIFNSAINHKKPVVNQEAVKCLKLYTKFMGASYYDFNKSTLTYVKRYMLSIMSKKKMLALELVSCLAKHSPYTFWFVPRPRSTAFVSEVLDKCLQGLDKIYDGFIDTDTFLAMSAVVIASMVDGRRAGLVVVGEELSQCHDFTNRPFEELYYGEFGIYNEDRGRTSYIKTEIESITDTFDDMWTDDERAKYDQFDLNKFLTSFSKSILDMATKSLPVSEVCEKSLWRLVNAVKILCRSCLRSDNDTTWATFLDMIMKQFPFVYRSEEDNVSENIVNMHDENNTNDMEGLSKKEKRLKKKRDELEKQILEKCGRSQSNINVNEINKVYEQLNYHIVGLIHQCLISGKISVTVSVLEWVSRLKSFLMSRDWSRNELVLKWLTLSKQIIQLSYDRFDPATSVISDIFIAFAHDKFLNSHLESKVKRVALAIYVDACLRSNCIGYHDISPLVVDQTFWDVLVDMIVRDCALGSTAGLVSPHPMYVSSQTHHDITTIKAAYLLLQENYMGVAYLFRNTDVIKKTILRQCFTELRPNIKESQYSNPKFWKDFTSPKVIPANYFWDYFTYDLVSRKNGKKENLRPLCSSIDDFLCQ